MTGHPKARHEGLLVEEMGDELIICDLERDVVHGLNGPAAACWKALDGTRDVGDLARCVFPDVDPATAISAVHYALKKLDDQHLLQVGTASARITRRDLLTTARAKGLKAAAVMAVVATLSSPPLSAHASDLTGGNGALCDHATDCDPGLCCCDRFPPLSGPLCGFIVTGGCNILGPAFPSDGICLT